MHWQVIYLVGALATAAGSLAADRTAEEYRRLPWSCHLLQAMVWPLFVGFVCCSALVSRRRAKTESGTSG